MTKIRLDVVECLIKEVDFAMTQFQTQKMDCKKVKKNRLSPLKLMMFS